jgi:hypothetical protein
MNLSQPQGSFDIYIEDGNIQLKAPGNVIDKAGSFNAISLLEDLPKREPVGLIKILRSLSLPFSTIK